MSDTPPPSAPSAAEAPALSAVFGALVSRPVAVTMVFLAALVFGVVSYLRLPIELMPDISYPTLTVRTTFEGAAPQELESQVSQPLEEALATLDGLVSLESRSRPEVSDVVLGFDWGTDMSAASQSVRESLQTTFLPEGADRPLLLRYDPSLEPFLRLALAVDHGALGVSEARALRRVRELADDEIKRRLEGMPGVAAVRVRGGLEREIRVEVREDWLAARRLTLPEVTQVLQAENINLAGGSIYEGDTEYLVRTLNEYRGIDELETLEIRRSDGVIVPITDVARITASHRERTVLSHLDGVEAVELEVFKEAGANVVAVAETVKAALLGAEVGVTEEEVEAMEEGPVKEALSAQLAAAGGLARTLPDGVRLQILDDQAAFIELAVANLRSAVVLGGLLAVVVLFLFLRDFKATAIIGLAIPVSVVVGFAPLYLSGVSLNLMSLGGLALGVGMLVDNAVVVLESIQRFREDGLPPRQAAERGVSEVAAAVVASTLTTVAVFAPIAFVEGVGGELFGDLSLAVVGSLVASLAVALFGVPTLAGLGGDGLLAADPDDEGDALQRTPGTDLRSAVRHAWDELVAGWRWARARVRRWLVVPYLPVRFAGRLLLALELFVGWGSVAVASRWSLWLIRRVARPLGGLALGVAGRFQAAYARFEGVYGQAILPVIRRPGTVIGLAAVLLLGSLQLAGSLGTELLPEVHQGRFTIEVALPVGTPLERTTAVVSDAEARILSHPDVATVYTTVGVDQRVDSRSDEGEHTARIRVQLEAPDGTDLLALEEAVMADLRGLLADRSRLEARFVRPSLFGTSTPLQVVVFGRDLDALRQTGDRVVELLSDSEALVDVDTSLQRGNPEIQIAYDRERLARFGLDTRTVATRVRDRVQGVEATEIHRGDQRLELRVQLVEDQRGSLDDLRRLNVNPQVQPPIPLEAVATFTEGYGPSEIRRVDQQRAVVVSANLAGFDMGSAVATLQAGMASLDLPEGQVWSLGGQAEELSGALVAMQLALGLAVFLVYVIMASTFEHLLHPFVILFTVPLAVVGVVGGLWAFGLPVGVVAFIGLIVLAGVVVNNAIVLVDAINRARARGEARLEAIHTAAVLRLRPILITTATTVLGLLPLAFGSGAGAEVQRPLAVAIIGGLSVSTLLTLVVIPSVYAVLTRGTVGRGAVGQAAAEVSEEPGAAS